MNFLKFLFIAGFFFFASPLLMAEAAAPNQPSAACDNSAATRSSIKATWGVVADALSYGYKIGSDGTLASTTATSASIDNLGSGQEYNINIRACSASECSGFAGINCLTNPAKPELTSSKNSTSITLGWSPIAGASRYQIGHKVSSEPTYTYKDITEGTCTTTLKSLASNTLYNIKIQACNANYKNNDGEQGYDEGCSGFASHDIKTSEVQDIKILRDSYEKKNLKIQKTLNGYTAYIGKSGELATTTGSDFNSEVGPILQTLISDLAYVKSATDVTNINNKTAALDSIQKTQVELLKYKLKIYTKCNGYYEKFKSYKSKVEVFLQIPGEAKTEFNGSGKHIDRAIDHYKIGYERAILSSKLSMANAANNLIIIKSLYSDLGKDGQYKLTKLVYESLYYVNNVNGKLIKFKEYSDNINKKYLSKVFADTAIATAYNTIINDFIEYYKGYVRGKSWSDYTAVSGDNGSLRKDGRYKRAAVILKGLSNINSIMAKTENYKNEINGLSEVSAGLKAKAGTMEGDIKNGLRDGGGSFGKQIVNLTKNSDEIYKQIRGYSGHKIFSYLYNGSKSLNTLNTNLKNIKSIVGAIGGCAAASGSITASEGKIADAVGKLENISLGNLDSAKQRYSEFKNLYQEALNHYKAAISQVKGCL